MIENNYLLDLEGRKKDNAISKLENDEVRYRITSEDNTNYMLTCDYDTQRVNLEIKKGVVFSASLG